MNLFLNVWILRHYLAFLSLINYQNNWFIDGLFPLWRNHISDSGAEKWYNSRNMLTNDIHYWIIEKIALINETNSNSNSVLTQPVFSCFTMDWSFWDDPFPKTIKEDKDDQMVNNCETIGNLDLGKQKLIILFNYEQNCLSTSAMNHP